MISHLNASFQGANSANEDKLQGNPISRVLDRCFLAMPTAHSDTVDVTGILIVIISLQYLSYRRAVSSDKLTFILSVHIRVLNGAEQCGFTYQEFHQRFYTAQERR